MKKASILFGVLAAVLVLTLVSCGGLLSTGSRNNGYFSFTIDDATLQDIARNASDTSTYTVKAILKTTSGNSYNQQKSISGTINALKSQTLNFTEIPLRVELKLEIEVLKGASVIYTANPQTFTLNSANPTEISMKLIKELNIPFLLTYYTENQVAIDPSRYTVVNTEDYSSYESLINQIQQSSPSLDENGDIEGLCVDSDGTLWYLVDTNENQSETLSLESISIGANGSSNHVVHINETLSDSSLFPEIFQFDIQKNQIMLGAYSYDANYAPESLHIACVSLSALTAMENEESFTPLFINCSTFDIDQDDLDQLYSPEYCSYAYNGNLYIHNGFFAMKFSTSDGTVIRKSYDFESLVNPENLNFESISLSQDFSKSFSYYTLLDDIYSINDIAVYKNTMFVLFSQNAYWYPSDKGQVYSDPDDRYDTGYISRGGIMLFDADTLAFNRIIGMPEIHDSYKAPAKLFNNYTEEEYALLPATGVPAYEDYEKTIPAYADLDVTWSMAAQGSREFHNASKIVAIKPKKLIIADNGSFLYEADDEITTSRESRLMTVDLENFSISELWSFPTESSVYLPEPLPTGHKYAAGVYENTTDYYPVFGPLFYASPDPNCSSQVIFSGVDLNETGYVNYCAFKIASTKSVTFGKNVVGTH